MTPIAELEWLNQHGYLIEQALRDLSQFSDEKEQSLWFYFGLDQFSDRSHHDAAIAVDHCTQQVVGTAAFRGGGSTDVVRELLSAKECILAKPRKHTSQQIVNILGQIEVATSNGKAARRRQPGKQRTLPTFPHRLLLRLAKIHFPGCTTLTISPVQNIGPATMDAIVDAEHSVTLNAHLNRHHHLHARNSLALS